MSKARLTRQELGWLLTQEAQGAAERLRTGVQVLTTQAPRITDEAPPSSGLGIKDTLDALDDTMKMLSSLHQKPTGKGRRGRIDLASLLWEVAPDARVSIEPGSGTEVFGDEGDLRRMLHVLVGQAGGTGSSVTIKRDEDEVKVSVVLGPDNSGAADTERAWISRMAIRYGGRYELEGPSEVLTLPADGVSERNEREALRQELDEARKQGEIYARELAAVFAQGGGESSSPSSMPPNSTSFAPTSIPPPGVAFPAIFPAAPGVGGVGIGDRFATLTKFAGGIAAELRGVLAPAARQMQGARSTTPSPSHAPTQENIDENDSIRRSIVRAQEFISALGRLGELDPFETPMSFDLVDTVRTVLASVSPKAQRNDVRLTLLGESPFMVSAGPRAVQVMARELVEQAISASPRGAEVTIRVGQDGFPDLSIDDAGAALPSAIHRAFVAMEVAPGTYGRSSSVPLYIASEIAARQNATLELADGIAGGLRVSVQFARSHLG